MYDVVRPERLDASFHHKVSIHNSCHGVRLVGLSMPSELNIPYRSKLRDLLALVEGVEVFEPARVDECCGFGGMFAVEEKGGLGLHGARQGPRPHVYGRRVYHGADSSCLMHMQGVIDRERLPIKTPAYR